MNIIDKPIAEKKLKERTLRKNTTKNLMNLVNQQQHSPNQSMDESEIDLALTQHYTSGRGDLSQTMKSIAKDQFDKTFNGTGTFKLKKMIQEKNMTFDNIL